MCDGRLRSAPFTFSPQVFPFKSEISSKIFDNIIGNYRPGIGLSKGEKYAKECFISSYPTTEKD
jgi:hypothetical protein